VPYNLLAREELTEEQLNLCRDIRYFILMEQCHITCWPRKKLTEEQLNLCRDIRYAILMGQSYKNRLHPIVFNTTIVKRVIANYGATRGNLPVSFHTLYSFFIKL
jgi:hypothetical protein